MSISTHNYEEYLIDYLHGELQDEQVEQLEKLMHDYPHIKAEWELLQQCIMVPDSEIGYPDKTSLYRKPASTKLVNYKTYMAVAASLLLCLAMYYWQSSPTTQVPIAATKTTTPSTPPLPVAEDAEMPQSIVPVSNTSATIQAKKRPIHMARKKGTISPSIVTNSPQKSLDTPIVMIAQAPPKQEVATAESSPQTAMPTTESTLPIAIQTLQNIKHQEENLSSSQAAVVLNQQKSPKLFSLINSLLTAKDKVKERVAELSQKELIVYVGEKKLIQLN